MKFCGWLLIAMATFITVTVFPNPNMQNYEVAWGLWGVSGFYTIFRANRMRKNGDRYMCQFNQPVVNHVVNYDYNVDVHVHNCNHTYDSTVKAKKTPHFKVVICSNCGAKMKVKVGSVVKCEYCDTPLGI